LKKSRFTESQIVAVLKEGESGIAVAAICRKHGVGAATYYQWKRKYAGVMVATAAGIGGRERQAQASVRRPGLGEFGGQGSSKPKILTSPARRGKKRLPSRPRQPLGCRRAEPLLGLGLHARRAVLWPPVPYAERDRRGEPGMLRYARNDGIG